MVHVRKAVEGQNSCAEQLKAGAAIRLAFDGFESADVAFYGAVAPCLGGCGFHSAYVLTQTANEAPHAVDAGTLSLIHPEMQALDGSNSQDGTKTHDQAAHGGKAWTIALESVDNQPPRLAHLGPQLTK